MNNDVISRSALLEHVKDVPTWWADDGGVYPGGPYKYPDGMFYPEDIISSIENAPAVDAAPRWISVKERLPDSQTDVLVVAFWHECWQPMIGWHSDSGEKWRVFTSHGEREPGGVTHWMPLPEPPKEG